MSACLRDIQHLIWNPADDHAPVIEELQRAIEQPDDVWDREMGGQESLTDFVSCAILRDGPVVVCFDEVDRVFEKDYSSPFFAMLRSWHNRRATHSRWGNLTLVLAHSTDPNRWIASQDQSPFNVADCQQNLEDFSTAQVEELNQRHGSPLASAEEIRRLMELTGGHPYLSRLALYWLRKQRWGVAALEASLESAPGVFGDHLRRLRLILEKNPKFAACIREILNGRECQDEDSFQFKRCWRRGLSGAGAGGAPA